MDKSKRVFLCKILSLNFADIKIGILGGGQLGRMLIQEAINLNIPTKVMDPDPNAPCKELSTYFYVGDLQDDELIETFGKSLDVVTIEIESVSVTGLKKLEDMGVKVYPQSRVVGVVQDKGLQKQFYQDKAIPTAPFFLIDNKGQLNMGDVSFPFVQKLRKGGYDGRGVQIIKSAEDFATKGFEEPSVIENAVDIDKEISVIVARDPKGNVVSYDSVEMEFNPDANLVEFLFAPSSLTAEQEEIAQTLARKVIEELDMVGILAVELFLDKEGNLVVNEIAPRAHNSGHQTIENSQTSQYMQLLRILLDLPLGSTALTSPGVMLNLLGEPGFIGTTKYEGVDEALAIEGVKLHFYGKKQTKPFRKMGHATVVDKDIESAKVKARKVQEVLKVKC